MRAVTLTLLLLGAPVLAGCLGGDEDADESVRRARAAVSEDLGGLEGVVTDEAVHPVTGANVTLIETRTTTRTRDDGSYAFSQLPPGLYTVSVNSGGFVSAQQETTVRAGVVATLDFVIARLFSQQPFTQVFELAGFFECGFAAGANLSALPAPLNVSQGIISFAVCATPNEVLGSNATNDRFSHNVQTDANLEEVVIETVWESSAGALSDQLWVSVDETGFPCGTIDPCDWTLLDHWGPSPLVGRIDGTRLDEVQAYFNEQCAAGEDEYCGYSFFDEGWPLLARVFPRWECQPAGPQACVIAQQPFTHYLSAFHNAPAPDGYSALG